MFFLFWTLLNVGLFLYFIFICLRATRRVWERVGLFAACLMVFGLLSFIGHSKEQIKQPGPNPGNQWVTEQEEYQRLAPAVSISKNLVRSPTYKITLDIQCARDPKTGKIVPITASQNGNGLMAGFTLKPSSVYLSQTNEENKYRYYVDCSFAWTLLGLISYHDQRTFTGVIELKDN